MGSSAKTKKIFFRGSPEHFSDKNAIWYRTPPHLHINCSLHVWGRAQGYQIFKRNSIISIRSKVMAFLVISLSPRGSRSPCIVPVIPTLSPSSPRCPHLPHVVPIAPKRSPWSVVSTCCPRRPCRPHIIPVVPTSSRRSPHHPQPPRYPLHPPPTPLGGWGPKSVKMQ